MATEDAQSGPLVQPCACTGTAAFAHLKCVEHWVLQRPCHAAQCELCQAEYLPEIAAHLQAALLAAEEKQREASARRQRYESSFAGRLSRFADYFWFRAGLLVVLLFGVSMIWVWYTDRR